MKVLKYFLICRNNHVRLQKHVISIAENFKLEKFVKYSTKYKTDDVCLSGSNTIAKKYTEIALKTKLLLGKYVQLLILHNFSFFYNFLYYNAYY